MFNTSRWAVLLTLFISSAGAFAQPVQMIEVSPSEEEAPSKVTIIVGPSAARRAALGHVPGQDNLITVDIDAGAFSGIRVSAIPYSDEHMSVSVEGFQGAAFFSPAYGGGVRVSFRVASGTSNALLISPGVDVLISPPDSSFFGHNGKLVYVLANADIAWVHEFASHFGFELGLRIGGGLQTGGERGTLAVPEVELFTGLRF